MLPLKMNVCHGFFFRPQCNISYADGCRSLKRSPSVFSRFEERSRSCGRGHKRGSQDDAPRVAASRASRANSGGAVDGVGWVRRTEHFQLS